jgi:hypothetical protein
MAATPSAGAHNSRGKSEGGIATGTGQYTTATGARHADMAVKHTIHGDISICIHKQSASD